MNASVKAIQRQTTFPGRSDGRLELAGARLVAAVDALSAYALREADPTLERLRLGLQGTSFSWSEAGEIVLSAERMALVDELDGIIDAMGGDTLAAVLFPALA